MSFGTRLREKREELGMKQSELGKLLGVTGSAIGNYENGVSSPKADILYRVFDVLHCDANYLFQDEIRERREYSASPYEMEHIIKKYRVLDPYGKDTVSAVLDCEHKRCIAQEKERRAISAKPEGDTGNIIYLPALLQAASAGLGDFADDETAERIAVQQNKITSKADCIIRVHGDSMEPKFLDGQQVLVRLQPAVELGEIGIFIRDGMRYIKIYRGSYLESANPDYGDTALEEYSKCIGKVLGVLEPSWIV